MIFKYKAALITVAALCILPSLYTLVNVRAIWNPYNINELNNIPVAVVNRDQGTTLRNKDVNLGQQVINSLKKNHQIGWRFVDKKEATEGLKRGRYYSEVEIPQNFSQRLISITTSHPQKAQLVYRTNTKNSPMGIKITETAANTLVNQIREKFVYEVNTTIFSYLNAIGKKASQNQTQILNLKDLIIALGDSMKLATASLGTINDTSNALAVALTEFKPVLSASENLNVFSQLNATNSQSLSKLDSGINQAFTTLNTNLAAANSNAREIKQLATNLDRTARKGSTYQLKVQTEKLRTQLSLLSNQLKSIRVFLAAINQGTSLGQVTNFTQSIANVETALKNENRQLKQLDQSIDSIGNAAAGNRQAAVNNIYQITSQLSRTITRYNQQVKGHLTAINRNLIASAEKSQAVMNSVKQIRQLNLKSLNTAIKGNQLVASTSGDLENKLLSYQSDIIKISNQLKLTSNDNIADIITVLQNNPELMGSVLAQPFNVKNEDIYKVSSFGAAFTPTYLAISIWVGCTMLVAVLHTKAPKLSDFRGITLREEYFGKLLTFATLSLVQTFIAITSTLLVLHVHVESFFLLIFVGILSSITFMAIIYTLASLFGNLGKALVMMLVALQLAGSGAMYPVQLNPLAFRILQPMFPFSYAVSGLREAIGGPNVGTVVIDFFVLFCMAGAAFAIGMRVKKPLRRYTDKLLNDFDKSGIGQ